MTYKNILLSALLVPFAIASNSDVRVQELKNKLAENKTCLEKLSAKIMEKEKSLWAIREMASTMYRSSLRDLNDSEKQIFENELWAFEDEFLSILKFDKNFIESEMKDLIPTIAASYNVNQKIKTTVIIRAIETLFLRQYYNELIVLLQEFSALGIELKKLSENNNNNH